jgi:hypothetical protein
LNVLASSSIISFAVEVSKQNSLTFTMPFDRTVLDLNHAISRRTGIPVTSQKLRFNENKMNDICLLSDYGIKTGSVIELVGEGRATVRSTEMAKPKTDSGQLQLSVRCQNRVISTRVKPGTTVAELKEMLAIEAGVPADTLWLICSGNMLRDESQLEQVGIQSGSTIVAGSKRRRTPDSIGSDD